jgi:hypothetical protein
MSHTGQHLYDAYLISAPFPHDPLRGHPYINTALKDTHLLLFHQVTLMTQPPMMTIVGVTVQTCHQSHPCLADALHPHLHLQTTNNPGQIMTPKWLAKV